MNKVFKKGNARVILLALLLVVASSLIPRPGTRAFNCTPPTGATGEKQYTTHRKEYGFPLPVAKRSVSDFDCMPADGKDFGGEANVTTSSVFWINPDKAHEQYVNGYVIIGDLVVNALFWTMIAYIVVRQFDRRKNG
jgi:hypothetical protein